MLRALSLVVIVSSLLVLPAYGTSNVRVFNYSSYADPAGTPVVVGEVINDGNESIKSVEVKASFIDPAGKILDTGSTFAAIDLIPPGQKSPFMITGGVGYAFNVKSFELQIVNFVKGPIKPAKLEIVNANQNSDGINEVGISGEIKNNSDKPATSTKVYVTFYGENNKVIGFTSVNAKSDSIAPNATTNFEFKVHDRVPFITSYTLYAESEQFSTMPYGLQNVGNPMSIRGIVNVSRLSLVDQQGNGIGKFAPNERAWIKSDITNGLSVEQEFTYIVQIKDQNGFLVELKWINGVLEPNMSISQSISWTADEEGIYYAEIFVWGNMENPTPLTSIKTIILLVST